MGVAIVAIILAADFFAASYTYPSSYSSRNLSQISTKSSGFGKISLSCKAYLKEDSLGFVKKNLAAAKMEASSSDQKAPIQVPTLILLENSEKKGIALYFRLIELIDAQEGNWKIELLSKDAIY